MDSENRSVDLFLLVILFLISSILKKLEASIVHPEPFGLSWGWGPSPGSLQPSQGFSKLVPSQQIHARLLRQPECPRPASRIKQVT